MARKIEVQVVGDADSLHRALGKAQGSTSKFGSVLGGAFRVGAVAAGGALLGLGYAAKRGIDEFNESQKVAAQLAAVLKSTGHSANVTASHVNKLSTSLSQMSGVDDEVITAGENLLLTFRNVRNEVGKGNDIFDQATKTTLDLSVAMGEDLHTATIQVGKALNDPIKGLTSLSRIGVTFSEGQKKLITHLVNTGHAMEAQKIILGELRKEFGGSAKAAGDTLAGQMNKLKNAFDEAAGAIIQQLLPYAVRLANFAFPLVVGAIQKVVAGAKHVIKWIADMASHFQILGGRSSSAGDRITNAWQRVVGFFRSQVLPIVNRLRSVFQDSMAAIGKVVQQHGAAIQRIMDRVGAALKAVAKVAIPILRYALVKVLPKAIDGAIRVLDNLSFALSRIVYWLKQAAEWADNLKSKLDILGGLNKGLLSGIDPSKGLLGQLPGIGHTSVLGAGAQAGGIFGVGGGRSREINQKIHVYLDGKEIHASVKTNDRAYRRQNGRSAFA